MAYLLFASGVFVLLFSVSQLLVSEKLALHYCMAGACLSVSYVFFYFWAVEVGVAGKLPRFLFGSDISAVFLTAPGFYLAARAILVGGIRPVKSYAAYFAIPGLFALGFAIYNGVADPAYLNHQETVLGHLEHPVLAWLMVVACAAVGAAIVASLAASRRLRAFASTTRQPGLRREAAFYLIYLVPAILVFTGSIIRSERLFTIGTALFCVAMIVRILTFTSITYFSENTSSPLARHWSNPEWDRRAEELSARRDEPRKG